MILDGIDLEFIKTLEGGQKLKGYVPQEAGRPIGASGVTIASGVDLGQMSKEEIKYLPISETLKLKLRLYADVEGSVGILLLEELPLVITKEEADELDEAIYSKIIGILGRLYNKFSKVTFQEIPSKAKTALASISINRGPHFGAVGGAYTEVWTAAIKQDWKGMITVLNFFPTTQKWIKKRRMREAELLNGL